MIGDMERGWKEAVMTVLSQHLPEGTEEKHKNLSEDNQCSGQDSETAHHMKHMFRVCDPPPLGLGVR